jgi:hypothetical protein
VAAGLSNDAKAFMSDEDRFWFPAKRYGWGWGLPNRWQGWLVLAIFVLLVGVLARVFPPEVRLGPFIVGVLVLIAALMAICYAKGEPPKWRWGGK